jgi:predicted nucleic acid-binding protein
VNVAAFVFDSEALAAVVRKDRRVQVIMASAVANDQRIVVPVVVLAELMTGGPKDAAYWHVVNRLFLCDATAKIAARAGALRERAIENRKKKRDLTLDALVAATAESFSPAMIVTGDADDMELLTAATEVRVLSL